MVEKKKTNPLVLGLAVLLGGGMAIGAVVQVATADKVQADKAAAVVDAKAEAVETAKREAQMVKDHRIWVGMTVEQLRKSVGKPSHVNSTTTAEGKREQWVFGGGYVYVEGGVVTAYQTTK